MYGIAKAVYGKEGGAAFRIRRAFRILWPFLLTTSVLFAGLLAFVGVQNLAQAVTVMAVLWVLPQLTVYQLITRIRNIAEHACVPNTSPLTNTRTVKASLVARMFMVPHNVQYHLEHHLFLATPWYNLPTAHKFMIENGATERMCIEDSYIEVLRKAMGSAQPSVTA